MTRRLLVLAGRLYPRAWRERYGEEFEALMADLPSQDLSTVWDVLKGAVAMQAKFNGGRAGRTAMIVGIVGGLVAGLGSFAISNVYVSSAMLENAHLAPGSATHDLLRALATRRVQSMIEKHKLYPGVDSTEAWVTMTKNIRVLMSKGATKEGAVFVVSFAYEDAAAARIVVTELTEAIMENQGPWKVLDSASLPRSHSEPNRPIVAFAGLLAGAVLGGVWAVWRAVFARAAN